MKNFDIGRKLGLNMCMKKLKNIKQSIFRMQKVNPCEATIVINKSDKVLVISMGSNWRHSPHITVYQIKRLDYLRCVNGKWQNFTFSKPTGIAIKLNNTNRW